MKVSNATSARATAQAQATGRSSAPLTPTSGDSFGLTGPSNPPDPAFHAYRQDLADTALAGRVIASHYAEPLERIIGRDTELRAAPSAESEVVSQLRPGDRFAMLDNSLGWAWGYAGADGRVGYILAEAVGG